MSTMTTPEVENKMNPEVKTKWLERLRSGTIPQIPGRLAQYGGGPGRCCLGVLCDIAVEEGVIASFQTEGERYYGSESISLPAEVSEWAGLPDPEGSFGSEVPLSEPVQYVSFDGIQSEASLITSLNDHSDLGFEGIADVIEEQL